MTPISTQRNDLGRVVIISKRVQSCLVAPEWSFLNMSAGFKLLNDFTYDLSWGESINHLHYIIQFRSGQLTNSRNTKCIVVLVYDVGPPEYPWCPVAHVLYVSGAVLAIWTPFFQNIFLRLVSMMVMERCLSTSFKNLQQGWDLFLLLDKSDPSQKTLVLICEGRFPSKLTSGTKPCQQNATCWICEPFLYPEDIFIWPPSVLSTILSPNPSSFVDRKNSRWSFQHPCDLVESVGNMQRSSWPAGLSCISSASTESTRKAGHIRKRLRGYSALCGYGIGIWNHLDLFFSFVMECVKRNEMYVAIRLENFILHVLGTRCWNNRRKDFNS